MGYDFLMPLGTASIIMALHNIADTYKLGLCKVSTYSALKNWSSVLNFLIVLAIPQEPERVRTCD